MVSAGAVSSLPMGGSNTDAGFNERIDANVYRGTATQLRDLVRNASYKPIGGRAPIAA